ncbi:MAG: hypothetical protein KF901_27690 [Myxococcales bacterium]|nr:hypothetical protein [Myxococcales bacterium]
MQRRAIPAALLFLATITLVGAAASASLTESIVFINGRATRVYFSDGDSFRQLDGPWTGRNSRLGGFNTLESPGPVHAWGNFHSYELYINAKQATLNARRGIWHCTGDGGTDTYGRVLLDCPDLAVDQIRKGFAHHMQIDDTPARVAYLRAQQEALRGRKGMWAHGIPSFVLTSLHSRSENPSRSIHRNRMVSVRDGHSEAWEHNDSYRECEWVCATEIVADEQRVREQARALRADMDVAPSITELPNLLLIEAVDRYARLGTLPAYLEPNVAELLEPRLAAAKAAGALGEAFSRPGACGLYVDFRRRYGPNRALCLRGHGTQPPQLQDAFLRR